MACTTILVGRGASYDGSTIIARNEDDEPGSFNNKKLIIVRPEDQPRTYTSVNGHLTIELPDDPLQYSETPNSFTSDGVWGEAGINEANVAMTATETITSNARALGADPLVPYTPAIGKPGDANYVPAVAGGIGEEDLVTIVLPYIHTAREGVERLGSLLEEYGTYESNGIGFSDSHEVWWIETVGGHHWIARRVPDDCYVVNPNRLGIDEFDFEDAFGEQRDYMCSADLREFMRMHHLDVDYALEGQFDPRDAFGSHSDMDHVYNTPRAWMIERYFNPLDETWEGPDADLTPSSDDIPWCRQPDHKITIEDVDYALAMHYQGTKFDPYGKLGTEATRHLYRPAGINRTCERSIMQIRRQTGVIEIQFRRFHQSFAIVAVVRLQLESDEARVEYGKPVANGGAVHIGFVGKVRHVHHLTYTKCGERKESVEGVYFLHAELSTHIAVNVCGDIAGVEICRRSQRGVKTRVSATEYELVVGRGFASVRQLRVRKRKQMQNGHTTRQGL